MADFAWALVVLIILCRPESPYKKLVYSAFFYFFLFICLSIKLLLVSNSFGGDRARKNAFSGGVGLLSTFFSLDLGGVKIDFNPAFSGLLITGKSYFNFLALSLLLSKILLYLQAR